MSDPLITLYQKEWCPYCERVRKVLTELGVPYAAVEVEATREDVYRVSGQRGVPTLADGEVVIGDDDDAIIAYLRGRYGKASTAADYAFSRTGNEQEENAG